MYIDTDLPCIQVMIYAGLRAPRPDMRENVYVGRCPTPRLGFFFGKKNPKDPKKPKKGKGKRRGDGMSVCAEFLQKRTQRAPPRAPT